MIVEMSDVAECGIRVCTVAAHHVVCEHHVAQVNEEPARVRRTACEPVSHAAPQDTLHQGVGHAHEGGGQREGPGREELRGLVLVVGGQRGAHERHLAVTIEHHVHNGVEDQPCVASERG